MAVLRALQKWRERLSFTGRAVARQYGAIPYMLRQDRLVFLLITSRGTGRWIFPKGSPIKRMTPWEAAAREAFEEAGVEGDIETRPIGTCRDMKTVGAGRRTIDIDFYPLQVTRQLDDWPEMHSRQRRWVALPDAERLLANPRMAELVAILEKRIASSRRQSVERAGE
jgi:8-oxo-dGTP pyrophosphatase MutT (NUDIX family)